MKNRLAIIGSGALGQQIAHWALQDQQYDIAGYYDDFQLAGKTVNSIPVLGPLSAILDDFKKEVFDVVLIGIGYNHMNFREETFQRFYGQVPFGKLIHSSCFVDDTASIGEGSVLYPRSVIDRNAKIGMNVLLNLQCIISHDSNIAAHSFLSPGVICSGFVNIYKKCNLGTGTIIVDNIDIKASIRSGAGTVITKNIDLGGLYVGVPATLKKTYDTL